MNYVLGGKNELYTNIHPFVKEMTGITIEQLNTAKPFKEICKEFIEFINEDKSILCIWGMCDIKELFRNIAYHKLDISLISSEEKSIIKLSYMMGRTNH